MQTPNPHHQSKGLNWCRWLVFFLVLPVARLESQEALRISLAGAAASAQRKEASGTVGYYNLLWGPVSFRFSAGESTEFNDNVRYGSTVNSGGSPSDVIFRPSIGGQLNWPVTEWNTLNVSLDAGYLFYAQNSDLNQFYLNPGSGLSFDVYVQDWVFTLHDFAKISQSALENPTQSGGGSSSLLENDAGVSGLWDLDKTVVSFGLDHVNYFNLTTAGNTNQLDSSSDNLNLSAGVRMVPEVLMGVSGGISLLSGSRFTAGSGAMQWNAGLFVNTQVSEHLSARLDAGYSAYSPDNPATNSPSEASALYFQLSVTHQVNERIRYSLSAGHSIDFEYGQPTDRYFVRLDPSWNFLRNVTIALPLSWEQGEQVATSQSVTYDQYSAGVTFSRGLTRKLSGSVYYRWVMETANQATLNYTANIVGLSLTWQF